MARWNVEGGLGPAFITGGTLIDGSKAHGVNSNFNDIDYSDAFKTGYRAELGGSRALSPNRKLTATGFYQKHGSDGLQDMGTNNGDQYDVEFSDLSSYGAELGVRQYFKPTRPDAGIFKNIRPYVEGKLGAAYVEPIKIESAFRNGVQIGEPTHGGRVTEGSWVPSAAGMVGVERPLFKHTTIGLETGIRYTGDLKRDPGFFGGDIDFAGANDNTGTWTVPITVRGRYRF